MGPARPAAVSAALELAPIRVNALAAGFVDTPLALHLMTNTVLTGATYDVDGGQQLIS